ncbi:hypothetical protein ACLOJK_040406 [Asimina triloba]
MAPQKAIDKGKAPIRDDDEQWTTGMVTRSQALGITIREIQEDMRCEVRETEKRTVPTVEPQAEQRAGEMQGIETAQTEGNDRGHQPHLGWKDSVDDGCVTPDHRDEVTTSCIDGSRSIYGAKGTSKGACTEARRRGCRC